MRLRAELVLEAGAELAEGPVWDDRTGQLLWVDIPAGRVHRTRPDGTGDTAIEVEEDVGAVALGDDGSLLAATRSGIRRVDPDSGHPLLAALPVRSGASSVRMNDGKCDPRGRFVAGTKGDHDEPGAGSLWSWDGQRLREVLPDVTISNGLAWSADGETLFYVDTSTRRIDAFDYDVDGGELASRRPAVHVPEGRGAPDGLTIDRDGGLWVALWGGRAVHRYVDGRLDAVIDVPHRFATSCTFGGPELDVLYITTAADPDEGRRGAILAVRLGIAGYAPARFRCHDDTPSMRDPGSVA